MADLYKTKCPLLCKKCINHFCLSPPKKKRDGFMCVGLKRTPRAKDQCRLDTIQICGWNSVTQEPFLNAAMRPDEAAELAMGINFMLRHVFLSSPSYWKTILSEVKRLTKVHKEKKKNGKEEKA